MTVKSLDDMLNDKADREFNSVLHDLFYNIEKLFDGRNELHRPFSDGRSNYEEMQVFRQHIFATLRDYRRESFKRTFLARHEQFAKDIAAMTNEQYTPDE